MSAPGGLAGTTVAVLGLGVIGGSLVRALARMPGAPRVLGASPDASDRRAAEREAGVRTASDAAQLVAEADVVVYAAPLGAVLEMLPAHAPLLRPDALVTDVAGLKRPLLDAARGLGLAARFVGSHPLAGGEGSGFAGGRVDLFEGARVFLCADPAIGPDHAARAEALWRALGADPEWTDADEHDRLMVRVSHLPQLVANALALTLAGRGVSPSDLGPGGRDMTRLAASTPRMWADLLAYSGPEVAPLLREMGAWVEELAARLEAGDTRAVSELMVRTGAWRAGARDVEARR